MTLLPCSLIPLFERWGNGPTGAQQGCSQTHRVGSTWSQSCPGRQLRPHRHRHTGQFAEWGGGKKALRDFRCHVVYIRCRQISNQIFNRSYTMTNTVIKAGVATRISDACKLFVCINCTFARRYSRKQNLVVTVCLEIYFCVDREKKKTTTRN